VPSRRAAYVRAPHVIPPRRNRLSHPAVIPLAAAALPSAPSSSASELASWSRQPPPPEPLLSHLDAPAEPGSVAAVEVGPSCPPPLFYPSGRAPAPTPGSAAWPGVTARHPVAASEHGAMACACATWCGPARRAESRRTRSAPDAARRGTRCPRRVPTRRAVPTVQPGAARNARHGPALCAASWRGSWSARPARRALCGSPMHDRCPCMVVCGPRAFLACPCMARCPDVLRAASVQLSCVSFVESHQCLRSTTACFYPSSTARRSSLSSPVSAHSALKSRVSFARVMRVVHTY
jgi:hypothetical protein